MQKISTKNLINLPDINTLKQLCKSLAILDAIICREWQYRYYSYNKDWDKANAAEWFGMRDGSGDEFMIYFSPAGAVIYGLAHESEMSSWFQPNKAVIPEILANLPNIFHSFVYDEPCKSNGASFCIWREYSDVGWQIGQNIPFCDTQYGDGSQDMLYILDNNPQTYRDWAVVYYEEDEEFDFEPDNFTISLVEYIYQQRILSKDVVLALNPMFTDWDDLKKDLDEIGYRYEL
jgi:hypothetical protein